MYVFRDVYLSMFIGGGDGCRHTWSRYEPWYSMRLRRDARLNCLITEVIICIVNYLNRFLYRTPLATVVMAFRVWAEINVATVNDLPLEGRVLDLNPWFLSFAVGIDFSRVLF